MKGKQYLEVSMQFLSRFMLLALVVGCGSSQDDDMKMKKNTTEDASAKPAMGFPEPLLSEYLTWTPVLNGDQAFKSAGHGGIVVRSYLNPTAMKHLAGATSPYPLAEGSILAKAVVKDMDTPASDASRVYFMRKEADGFDSANNNWSYAVANRVNGSLMYDSNINPREELCVSCHAKFSAFDYVQTVDFYLRQTAGN